MTTEQARPHDAATTEATSTGSTDYTPRQRRRILGAACLGWGMEYFDFMLPSLQRAGPAEA